MDVFHDGFEGGKVGNFGERVTGLLKQGGVDDDAEALIAVTKASHFAGFFEEVEVIGGLLGVDFRAGKVIEEVTPGVESCFVAALEQRRRGCALVHLGGQGLGIGAGGSGDDGDRHAGHFGILRGERLPCGIGFRLEVEIVYLAVSGRHLRGRSFRGGGCGFCCGFLRSGGGCGGGACKARKRHHGNQNQSK